MLLSDKIGDRNITLIGGLNGRGKTTFHDAILSLYGKSALTYIQKNARSYDKRLIDHINKCVIQVFQTLSDKQIFAEIAGMFFLIRVAKAITCRIDN